MKLVPDSGVLTAGSRFSISWTFTSLRAISKIKVQIRNSSGVLIDSASVSPNTTSYSLASLASSLQFERLTKGKYTVNLIVSEKYLINTFSKRLASVSLTVSDPLSAASVLAQGFSSSGTLAKGSVFTIRGIVKASNKLSKVTVAVKDSSGGNTVYRSRCLECHVL